jgi:hypothetical protein
MDARFWREKVDPWLLTIDSFEGMKEAWEEVVEWIDAGGGRVSKGHPYFRLGELHLVYDESETEGRKYLREALDEDKRFAPAEGKLPQAMGAYTLLALVDDFLGFLNSDEKSVKPWMKGQLKRPHRQRLFEVLFTVYNETQTKKPEPATYTHRHLSSLFKNEKLLRFAAENYRCAHTLVALCESGSPWLTADEQYAVARAAIGLYGGAFEALLVDWFPPGPGEKPMLGTLIARARESNPQVIKDGTALAGLSIFLSFFRNHIHPGREVKATYDIGLPVAKGVGIALNWAFGELGALERPCPAL